MKVFTNTGAIKFESTSDGTFGFSADGGGTPLTVGVKQYIPAPFGGTILSWFLTGDVVGSIQVRIWRSDDGSLPTILDDITPSDPPALVAQSFATGNDVSGWGTTFTEGSIFAFVIDETDGEITKLSLTVKYAR